VRIIALLLMLLLFSCSPSLDSYEANEDFVKKYNEEVLKINEQRKPTKQESEEVISSKAPTEKEVEEDIASKVEYYPYVGISQIGDAPKQSNIPNLETYEQGTFTFTNTLLPNIFEVSYNLALYPPFSRIGTEFDAINVPKSDAFGVTTELSSKSYLLAGNNSLQRSIDSINSEKTDTDIEIAKMLVQEKKKMQKQNKTKQIFGDKLESNSSVKTATIKTEETKAGATLPKVDAITDRISGFVRSVSTTPTQK
jgi:hypothetical protein